MQFAVMPTLDQVPGTAHQLIALAGLVFGLVWFWLVISVWNGFGPPGGVLSVGFQWVSGGFVDGA